MAMPPPLNTYASLVSTFASFLTVAIHTILYERSIYPEASFLSARKYNFPVRQNRHPKVCSWINDAVAAVEAELLKVSLVSILGHMISIGDTVGGNGMTPAHRHQGHRCQGGCCHIFALGPTSRTLHVRCIGLSVRAGRRELDRL